jgi:hypothetical protein
LSSAAAARVVLNTVSTHFFLRGNQRVLFN